MSDDPMQRWQAAGYRPRLVFSGGKGWTLMFGQESTSRPEWARFTGAPIWQATEQEAIDAAVLDEQMAANHPPRRER